MGQEAVRQEEWEWSKRRPVPLEVEQSVPDPVVSKSCPGSTPHKEEVAIALPRQREPLTLHPRCVPSHSQIELLAREVDRLRWSNPVKAVDSYLERQPDAVDPKRITSDEVMTNRSYRFTPE